MRPPCSSNDAHDTSLTTSGQHTHTERNSIGMTAFLTLVVGVWLCLCRYRQDQRYLKVWITYADRLSNPSEIFQARHRNAHTDSYPI
jgi:hypothetical protein